jgi:hypothetical protein
MGIPILRGRDYSPDDLERPHVSIISEAVERQFFPGQSAVGRRIYCGLPSENHADWHEVIGVVGDVADCHVRRATCRVMCAGSPSHVALARWTLHVTSRTSDVARTASHVTRAQSCDTAAFPTATAAGRSTSSPTR